MFLYIETCKYAALLEKFLYLETEKYLYIETSQPDLLYLETYVYM